MSKSTTPNTPAKSHSWALSLAMMALFSFGGLSVVLYGAERDRAIPDGYTQHEAGMHLDRVWSAKCEMLPNPYPCHSCERRLLNGRDVLLIQFVAGGDLISIDALTGEFIGCEKPKLLGVRED